MSYKYPKEFEKEALATLNRSLDGEHINNSKVWLSLFAIVGLALLVIVYFLNGNDYINQFWLYLMTFISGVSIGGAGIINKISAYSKIHMQYINRDAVKERIKELYD